MKLWASASLRSFRSILTEARFPHTLPSPTSFPNPKFQSQPLNATSIIRQLSFEARIKAAERLNCAAIVAPGAPSEVLREGLAAQVRCGAQLQPRSHPCHARAVLEDGQEPAPLEGSAQGTHVGCSVPSKCAPTCLC